MRKCFSHLIIGLTVILAAAQGFANGEELESPISMEFIKKNGDKLELPISTEVIKEKVSDHLSSTSLYPYIKPGKNEVRITGVVDPIIDDEQIAAVFLEGEFGSDEKSLKGLFAVHLVKGTSDVQAKLLCLSDTRHITPILFFDIVNGPQLSSACPEGMKLLREKMGIFLSALMTVISKKNVCRHGPFLPMMKATTFPLHW